PTGPPSYDVTGGIVGQVRPGRTCEVTATMDAQVADCWRASVTVQEKGVDPTGNNEPDAGEQPTVSGATPPAVVGAKLTATGWPVDEVAEGTGQVMVGGVPARGVVAETSADGALYWPDVL